MPRVFTIFFVFILASYSISHRVLKVPVSMSNIENTQVDDSTVDFYPGNENNNSIWSLKCEIYEFIRFH